MEERRRIRTLFTALLVLLPLQYAWVGVEGVLRSEPWPALVFPGFKNVYSDGDRFYVNSYHFTLSSGDELITVGSPVLFPELPLSQQPGFMRTHFGTPEKAEALTEDQREWLYLAAEKIAGIRPDAITLSQSRAWFSRPSPTLEPDSAVVHFEIEI